MQLISPVSTLWQGRVSVSVSGSLKWGFSIDRRMNKNVKLHISLALYFYWSFTAPSTEMGDSRLSWESKAFVRLDLRNQFVSLSRLTRQLWLLDKRLSEMRCSIWLVLPLLVFEVDQGGEAPGQHEHHHQHHGDYELRPGGYRTDQGSGGGVHWAARNMCSQSPLCQTVCQTYAVMRS